MSRTRWIPLTKGQRTRVPAEHYADLAQFKWQASWNSGMNSYYAVRDIRLPNGKKVKELMHRRILGLAYGDPRETDHLNHDTLDNSLDNLRIVTHRQNCENFRHHGQYGVGVELVPSGRFRSRAWNGDTYLHLGTFDTPEEAQSARAAFLKEHE